MSLGFDSIGPVPEETWHESLVPLFAKGSLTSVSVKPALCIASPQGGIQRDLVDPFKNTLVPPGGSSNESINVFAKRVLNEDVTSLTYLSQYIRRSYYTVYTMYCALFVVGCGTAIAAIIKGFLAQSGSNREVSAAYRGG